MKPQNLNHPALKITLLKTDKIKLKKAILLILGISILEYLISFLALRLHFEWIDDIFVMLQLKGEVINVQRGYFNLRINNYFAYLHCWLYNNFDGFNWYGISLTIYSFFCIFNINFILFYIASKIGKKTKKLFVAFSLAFMVAYLVENVYLLNFTRLGILLTYTSIICVVIAIKEYPKSRNRTILISLLAFFFFCGWNSRLTAALAFLPIAILFLFLVLEGKKRFLAIAGLLVYTALYVVLSVHFLNYEDRKEFNALNDDEKYIHNILNAFNGNEVSSITNQRDSIKTLAFYRWYFADRDSIFNQTFLEKVGNGNPLDIKVLKDWRKNIKQEVVKAKSRYNSSYLPSMNWYYKSVVFIIIILLLPFLIFYFSNGKKSDLFKSILFIILSYLFILVVLIFLKMEDRVLAPLLIFIFLGSLILSIGNSQFTRPKLFWVLIIIFALIGVKRAPGYRKISNQRRYDLDMKTKIRYNMSRKYHDKIIFFDLYSYTMLETNPLWDVNYHGNWVSGPEMYNLYNEKHNQKIEHIVGCVDWPCFFQEISKNPEKYMFFYSVERIKIAEDYHKIIYDYDLKFKKESDSLEIDRFHYSLLWIPTGLGYYTVDTNRVDTMITPIIKQDSIEID